MKKKFKVIALLWLFITGATVLVYAYTLNLSMHPLLYLEYVAGIVIGCFSLAKLPKEPWEINLLLIVVGLLPILGPLSLLVPLHKVWELSLVVGVVKHGGLFPFTQLGICTVVLAMFLPVVCVVLTKSTADKKNRAPIKA